MKSTSHLIWMDLEMTGLFPDKDTILEIATIITDKNLEIIACGPEFVIRHEPEVYERMDNWNQKHHKESGLWDMVIKSEVSCAQAEEETLKFLQKYCKKNCVLAGNSIWQDRRFLINHMPKLDEFCHYRMLDISSLKILYKSWTNDPHGMKKENKHRATDDIKESIAELDFYRKKMGLFI